MANTTDIMIMTFCEEPVAIAHINSETGIDLRMVTDATLTGGKKVVAFEAYAFCGRAMGRDAIEKLIRVFKSAPFEAPDYAVMAIDDDNGDFRGVVRYPR